jgi:molybdate transport system permease protein
MTSRGRWLRTPLPWLAALLVLYLLSPIGDFLGRLATSSRTASPGTGAALAVSAETATIATAVIAVLGVPLAYLLARGRSRRSAFVGIAVQLPIALPPLISGILLLYLVGPYSAVGRFFGGRLTDDRAGIVLAQIFVAAPFLIVAARSAFASIDPAFDDVAATLGHGRLARFAKIAVPTAMPGIVAGLLLAWLRGFGEFGATVVLAYHPYSLPVFTYVQFGSTGLAATLLPTAAAVGAAVVVLGGATLATRRLPHRVARRRPLPASAQLLVRSGPPRLLAFDLQASAGTFTVHALGTTARCLAILGATGAGKTLTLRALAGIHPDVSGTVLLGDRHVDGVAVERRRVGYVPQESCLLPHLRVREQVCLAADADPRRAAYWLQKLDLTDLADRRPDQLSGGQRRRVALARALTADPELLLLDEPFSGLDTPTRTELRRLLRRLLAETPVTTVLVTHDPEDVAMLAEDVAVMDRGRTVQCGSRAAVYRSPAGAAIAHLLGIPNAIEVSVVESGRVQADDGTTLAANTSGYASGQRALAVMDPRAVHLDDDADRKGTAVDVIDHPTHRAVEVSIGVQTVLVVHAPLGDGPCNGPVPGEVVGLDVPTSAVRLSALPG